MPDFLRTLFASPPEGSLVRLVVSHISASSYKYVNASLLQVSTKGLIASLGTNQNVWFTPAVLHEQGDEKAQVLASRVLWVDIDDDTPPRSPFPPTFIVSSGHGYHYYWSLKDWLTDVGQLEELNKQLATEVGGDIACYNCNRLLRVPDTINIKEGHDPVPVMLLRGTDITYAVEDFAVLAKLNDKVKAKLASGDSRGYRSRSERDFNLMRALLLAGASEDLVRRLATHGAWNERVLEGGEKYFQRTLARAKMRQEGAGTTGTGQQTGVIEERDDGYWITYATGGAKRITTFRFEPTLLLEHPECDVLRGNVRAAEIDYVWEGVTFTRRAFNSHAAFVKELPYASWQVLCGDHEVQSLLPYLMKQLTDKGLPRVQATSVLGRHGDRIVGVKYVITKDGVRTYDDAPIVYVDSQRERPAFLAHPLLEAQASELHGLLQRVLSLNARQVTYPLVGWFAASAFKPVLNALGVRFPILDVFGTKGSGKTTTIHLLSRMFGNTEPVSYDATTTRFVTLALMGATNSVPVSFSEFRAAHGTGILRYILLSYDVGRDARGHADQTTTTYPLLAPIVVDGEDMVSDPAAKERIIAVNMHDEELTDPRRETLLQLSPEEVSSFAIPYLRSTLSPEVDELLRQARQRVSDTFPERIPDRVRNNLSTVAFGLGVLHIDWTRADLEVCLSCVYNAKMARTEAAVDDFVVDVVNGAAQRKSDFFWHSAQGVLWFQFTTAHSWWQQLMRRTGSSSLARDSLRIQLRERMHDYMLPLQMIGNKLMFGVDLKKAVALGLDVPTDIASEQEVILKFGKETQ